MHGAKPIRSLVPFGTGRAYAASGSGVLVYGQGCVTYLEAVDQNNSGGSNVTFFDGTSSNGQQMIDYTLTQNQSTSEFIPLHSVPFTEGLYMVTNSGSVSGSITMWVNHSCAAYVGAQYRLVQLQEEQLAVEVLALQAAGIIPTS